MKLLHNLFSRKKRKSTARSRRLNRFEVLENRCMLAGEMPMFDNYGYYFDVDPGDVASGTYCSPLGQVSATDPDSTVLDFALVASTDASYFDIDTTSGEITVSSALTEDRSYYFDVEVVDESGNTATTDVSVNVPLVTPVAEDDYGWVDAGMSTMIQVLQNDWVTNWNEWFDTASVTITSAPSHGTIAVDPFSGDIEFTANTGFVGTDQFQYTFADSAGTVSNAAVVDIEIYPAMAPTAQDIGVMSSDSSPIAVDVTENDYTAYSEVYLDLSTVQIVTAATNGTLVVDSTTGVVTYTPNPGFSGSDSFTYTVEDDNGTVSNIATVDIELSIDFVPVLTSFNVWFDSALQQWTLDGTVSDEDPSGCTVYFGGMATGHMVSVQSDGSFTYALDAEALISGDLVTANVLDTMANESATLLRYA